MVAAVIAAYAQASAQTLGLADVLLLHDHALGAKDAADFKTLEVEGTISGEGLSGTFHSWRSGDRERSDESLGPRSERSLRLGSRHFVQNENGNVRELSGLLLRRQRTADFIDSDDFVKTPSQSKLIGEEQINGHRTYRVQVVASNGEPETVFIDAQTGLIDRAEYIEGDGPVTIDFADYQMVAGHPVAYSIHESDGDHAFDVIETLTKVRVDQPIAETIFAPLQPTIIDAVGAQTVPLTERAGHLYAEVALGDKKYLFLLDTGAQSILLDAHVVTEQKLHADGAMEVRGAGRSGGLKLVRVGELGIGTAKMHDVIASSIDLGESTVGSFKIDGILGYPFFASAVVKIDAAHHTMTFGPPGSVSPVGTKVALEMDRQLPEADARINRSLDGRFVIDTGSGAEVLIYHPFYVKHPGFFPMSSEARNDFGIGGSTSAYRISLNEVNLGGFPMYHRYTDVILSTQGAFADRYDAGNIGLGFLKNFIVTFDEANNALYLERGADFDDGRGRPGPVDRLFGG